MPQHGKKAGIRPLGGAKRHRKVFVDNIRCITHSDIRRLARRGGVRRISFGIYNEVRDALRSFLEIVVHDAVQYCYYGKRRTVTTLDIIHALKRQGRSLYGYG
ncbi:unnamed protein product [Colletotrichum noveboracense]|uniref:Histone H4 n=1 Tax=Colletotrichum noveboracense TaxID=2664923 RepID=A0A9W4S9Y8_9PEZI|nr:unnamed protein product [Colletotrichum noveboracense]